MSEANRASPASGDAGDPSGAAAPGRLAIVLSGGGARGAYQAGVLRGIARHLPDLRFPILCGISAGGINASFLAAHPDPLGTSAPELCAIWRRLHAGDIFHADATSLARHFARWVARLASGGTAAAPEVRGLVDPRPLQRVIESVVAVVDGEIVGIAENIERGHLQAVTLTTLNYTTGQTVTWVQGDHVDHRERPRLRTWRARLSVDHVLASAALPLFFPAVRLGNDWHGDGGMRLDAPFSAPLHLGATRILAISPRYEMTMAEADRRKTSGYPPPAQILSQLINAIFLDVLDRDAARLQEINRLIPYVPPAERHGLRPVDILVLRPSVDLGLLAADYEDRLPPAFRYLTRSLGTRETTVPDFLSIVLFEPDYLQLLLEIGERDAEAKIDDIRRLLASPAS
jgi:NTE family protein